MKYAIVYSSKTGNTKLLAQTLRARLLEQDCIYFGEPDAQALEADCLLVGFWTDKGSCDASIASFLGKIRDRQVFLFGTAGFGGQEAYFDKILGNVRGNLDESVTVTGTYMCQGKMPAAVRLRYEKMMEAPDHAPNVSAMLENFDRALSHPDKGDLERLEGAFKSSLSI